MTDPREKLIDALVTAFLYPEGPPAIEMMAGELRRKETTRVADHALKTLNLTPAAAAALMDGTAVVVPIEPTDEQLKALEKAGGFNLTGYLDAIASSPYRSNSDE
ncbi:hypothetical protein ACUSIJ_24685 [Pseudochelatococcus sp. B33]